jgi:hypothetical protein
MATRKEMADWSLTELLDRIEALEDQLGYVDNHRRELQFMLHEHGICPDCGKKYEHCDVITGTGR